MAVTALLLLSAPHPVRAMESAPERGPERSPGPPAGAPLHALRSGFASWYAAWWGRPGALYAAHPDFRLGVTPPWRERVCTTLPPRRCVTVTVMDAGPSRYLQKPPRNRIIDLSPAAFARLAPLGSGLVRVTSRRLP